MPRNPLALEAEPVFRQRYASIAQAFADPDCPQHYLLNLPILGVDELDALRAAPNPSPAVLDRAVRVVCQDVLSTGARLYREVVLLLRAQPGLTEEHLRSLMRATVERPVPDGDADMVVRAFLDHPAGVSDLAVADLLRLPFQCHTSLRPAHSLGASRDGVVTALRRRRHPVAAVLELWVRSEEERIFNLESVQAGLDELDRWAAEAGSDRAQVAATVLKLAPSWAGTGRELEATVRAVLARR